MLRAATKSAQKPMTSKNLTTSTRQSLHTKTRKTKKTTTTTTTAKKSIQKRSKRSLTTTTTSATLSPSSLSTAATTATIPTTTNSTTPHAAVSPHLKALLTQNHPSRRKFATRGSKGGGDDDASGQAMDDLLNVVSPELIFGSAPYMAPSTTGVSVSRVYTNANATKPREHWDYDHHRILYHTPDGYDAYRKLGRGKYSEVFAGMKGSTEEPVIIKVLKPIKKKKIRREVLVMKHLLGMPYCPQLIDVLKDPVNRVTTLITRFNEAEDFKTLFPRLSPNHIRIYMYQLLWALDHAHSQGIMHRDVKPQNVVIDHENQVLRLIDWGLAEFYHPNTEYNARVASRYFKAPELLLNMRDYDYSNDLWSFGATFAGMIYVVHPFFNGIDNLDMIDKQARVLGSEDFFQYMKKYKVADPDGEFSRLIGNHKKKGLDLYINNVNKHLATDDAVDLLSKVLVVDHNERLSAKEAMAHPFFDPVRNFVISQHEQLSEQLKEEMVYRDQVDKQFEHVPSEELSDVLH